MGDISTLNLEQSRQSSVQHNPSDSVEPQMAHLTSECHSIIPIEYHLRVVFVPPPLRLRDTQRRLSTLESRRHLSVCMLTLLTPSCGLSLS